MTDQDITVTFPSAACLPEAQALLCVTVLWHPDWLRAGEQCLAADGRALEISRFAGAFARPGAAPAPLGHRSISREPVRLRRGAGNGVLVEPPASRMAVELNGRALHGPVTLAASELEQGAVLALGGTVLLCLHWMRCLPRDNAVPGVLGVSDAAITLRSEIAQAASTDLPVLLLGATGTGKEVAARAIHALSARRAAPLVSVNMATLQDGLAAAELFGASKGAYTGAGAARAGLFDEAGGGTLFLDEIGNTPAAVQPMLLRVLESGEYRPLGGSQGRRSNARLLAATDQELEAQAPHAASFNQPLLRRLEGFVIRLPPLRARRADIGLLVGQLAAGYLSRPGAILPMPLVQAWCCHDWPGNIRQLANSVRRALIALEAGEAVDAPVQAPWREPADQAPRRAKLEEISDAAVLQAMETSGWCIRRAAHSLGVSRPSMYKLLGGHPQVRPVEAISRDEIADVLLRCGGDLHRSAAAMKTPSEALRRRARLLGLLPR